MKLLILLFATINCFAISRGPAVDPIRAVELGEEAHIKNGEVPTYRFRAPVVTSQTDSAQPLVPWGLIAVILSFPLLSLFILGQKKTEQVSTSRKVSFTVIEGEGGLNENDNEEVVEEDFKQAS